MPKQEEIEQIWHNDKHVLLLRINKSELEVLDVICPADKPEDECINSNGECVVKWFIDRYGMECNGGICMAQSEMQICWTLVGDKNQPEGAQLWFMPLSDEIFQAWLVANTE